MRKLFSSAKTAQDWAAELARRGKAMNNSLVTPLVEMVEDLPGEDLFPICIAHALVWSGHADEDDPFYDISRDYLEAGVEDGLPFVSQVAGRHGGEALLHALVGYRSIIEGYHFPDLRRIGAANLCQVQDDLMTRAGVMESRGNLHGVGPWIFCGPFKMLALMRPDLWRDPGLDRLYMPLGLEVNRGVAVLMKEPIRWGCSIPSRKLGDERGFCNGMAALMEVQDFQQKLAGMAGSRILDINSGLHRLGENQANEAAPPRRSGATPPERRGPCYI